MRGSPALGTWLADVHHRLQEHVWDRLRARRRCTLLPSALEDPALANRPVRDELDHLFRVVVGRRLTRHVVGVDHPRRCSLTDFLDRGVRDAWRVLPYVRAHERLLEYGGGVGRVGRSIAPHVRELVSADVNPLSTVYGPWLSPRVDFRALDEVAESEAFDGAYSIAVFFHLRLEEQRRALEYVHRRLKPGGWFLVDLKIGPETLAPRESHGNIGYVTLDDFRGLYEPFFTARPVPLFYSGFLMTKR